MKANELRIGNYVKDSSGIKKMDNLDKFIRVYEELLTKKPRVKPVKLTEEILLKCGFSEDDLSRGRILINQFNGIDNGFIIRKYTSNIVISKLHQLQNIHFALTGTELEVNL